MITFVLFAGAVVLLFWTNSLSGRISKLERQTRFLSPDAAPPRPPEAATPAKVLPHAAQAPVVAGSVAPFAKNNEAEVASGWLAKIGVLALLFGIAFFFKFAIDQGWISQWTRVIMGLAAGTLLVILGGIWKGKYRKYAQVLAGGGVGLLYFSIFAAFQFYSLVPQAAALAFMVIATVLTVGLAYRYQSVPLAVLGVVGAYLSPILLHNNLDQQTGLFVYLGLLNAAALAVLARYFWVELLYLSLFGTVANYLLWFTFYSGPGNTLASVGFLMIMLALWIWGGVIILRRASLQGPLPEKTDAYFGLFCAFSGIFYAAMMATLLFGRFHDLLPFAGLSGAAVALLAYAFSYGLGHSKTNYSLALLGVALAVLAAVWQYSGNVQNFAVIALGLAAAGVGVGAKRAELRFWGVAALGASLLMVLLAPYDRASYGFVFNAKFGLMIWEAAALLCVSRLYGFVTLTKEEKHIDAVTGLAAVFLIWLAFSWELAAYFQNSPASSAGSMDLLLSLWWISYATIIMLIGAARRASNLRKAAIILFGLSILKVFLYDVQALDLGYRVVSFIALGVILLLVSFAYQKNKEKVAEFLEGGKGEGKLPKTNQI